MSDIKRVGIVGGGQLATMMIEASRQIEDVQTSVFVQSTDEPATLISDKIVVGSFQNSQELLQFLATVDHLTFDLENVSSDFLDKVKDQEHKIFPSPAVLRMVQNKLHQKQFLIEHGFSVAPLLDDTAEAPYVLKAVKGGYDGKGVWKVTSCEAHPHIPSSIQVFKEAVAEIYKELSVLVVRSRSGEVQVYEPVEMCFRADMPMLDYLLAPARMDQVTAQKAKDLAIELISLIQGVGVFAIEMFWCKNGELWINEIAPRPHNSGHHTIDSCEGSQFENHLRAGLGLPLKSTRSEAAALLMNVVGHPDTASGTPLWTGIVELKNLPNVKVKDYLKKEVKPFRKMGHVTVLGQTVADVLNFVGLKDRIICKAKET